MGSKTTLKYNKKLEMFRGLCFNFFVATIATKMIFKINDKNKPNRIIEATRAGSFTRASFKLLLPKFISKIRKVAAIIKQQLQINTSLEKVRISKMS